MTGVTGGNRLQVTGLRGYEVTRLRFTVYGLRLWLRILSGKRDIQKTVTQTHTTVTVTANGYDIAVTVTLTVK